MSDIVERLRADAEHAKANLPNMIKAVEMGAETASRAADEIEALKEQLAEANRFYSIAEAENGRLAGKIERLKRQFEDYVERVQQDIAHLKAERDLFRRQLDEAEAQLKQAWSEIDALRAERDEFASRATDWQITAEAHAATIESENGRICELLEENLRLRDPENLRLYANTHEGKDKWLETNGSLYLKWSVVADYLRVSPRKRSAVKEPPPDWMGVLHP